MREPNRLVGGGGGVVGKKGTEGGVLREAGGGRGGRIEYETQASFVSNIAVMCWEL